MVVLAATASMPALAQEPPRQPPPTGKFASGQILVKFKPGVGGPSAQRALAAQSLTVASAIPSLNVLKVSVKPGQDLEQVAALRGNPNVLYAEPNYVAHAVDTIPNDVYSGDQWRFFKIGAPLAWDMTTGDSSVIIAIVDTGIDLDHEDFNFNCPGKLTAARWNFVAGNNTPNDDNGHGTHVAGIAAACGNNGIGVAGVAWGARLMPVKVLDSSGNGYYSDVADGVIYAVDHGAKVVNLSLGGPDDSSTLADAIQYAYQNGVLVAAAAGNTAGAVLYPAAYPHVLAVAATDSLDRRYSASSFGPQLDLAAPGVSIYSTIIGEKVYGTMTGTSMATAHVSGLAALLWSFAPSLTVDQVENAIESTADDLGTPGRDDYFGYGRINAGRALSSLALQISPALAPFLVGDNGGPFPALNTIQVTTLSSSPITWTASISPPVEWLSIVPPDAGTVSAASWPPAVFALAATRPITYGTYTTTAVVSATTSSGGQISPATTQIRISYLATLYIYRFPIILEGSGGE